MACDFKHLCLECETRCDSGIIHHIHKECHDSAKRHSKILCAIGGFVLGSFAGSFMLFGLYLTVFVQ